MSNDFGDARMAELEFLADLSQKAGRSIDDEILNPGPHRDMIALLVHQGYVNDLRTHWVHDNAANAKDPGRGYLGKSRLERQLHQERVETLSRVLGGQSIQVHISHRGRVRISELTQELQKNRIREGFGILWDKRHIETDLRIAALQASELRPFTVAFMDMNGLKQINDDINHDAGDAAIKAYFHIAELLLGTRGDVYCAGGDEVVAILPNHDQEQALILLRAMCQALKSEKVRIGGSTLPPLTISIGVVTTHKSGISADVLRRQADEAMYRGKEQGKTSDPRPSSIAVHGVEQITMV